LKDLETNPERVLKHLGMDDVEAAREAIEGKVEEVQGILSGIQSDLSIERREARRAITEVKARVEQTAKTEFPWVSDPKDPRAVLRKNSLAALGPYANHPSAPLFSAVWAQWLHDYNARSAKPAAKTEKPAAPKAVVARRTAAPPAAQPPKRGDAAGAVGLGAAQARRHADPVPVAEQQGGGAAAELVGGGAAHRAVLVTAGRVEEAARWGASRPGGMWPGAVGMARGSRSREVSSAGWSGSDTV